MALPLKEWTASIKDFMKWANDDSHVEEMWTKNFMRDPLRSVYMDDKVFYTPADGIILYQQITKPTERIIEIKGINYTLQDIMEDQTFDQTCLVIGVFMTYYDVHINRVPYHGIMTYRQLSPTMSYNKPMIFTERNIDNNDIFEAYKNMSYVKTNARMLNTFYNPNLDYKYYVTQIADNQVNVITHFTTRQQTWFSQGDRFSFVRWGSQVELVLPMDDRFKFETIWPNTYHVETCKDALVRLTKL